MKKSALTRLTILEKAFALIYTKGYQATSVDDIIATTEVSKGAFYYHFKTKDDMGLAIVKEIVRPRMEEICIQPLDENPDPINVIYNITKSLLVEDPFLKWEFGCPVSNFSQELAPWHGAFKEVLAEFISLWKVAIVKSIDKAKESGIINKDADGEQVAYLVISGYWGIRNVGKIDDPEIAYTQYLNGLKTYLNSLGKN